MILDEDIRFKYLNDAEFCALVSLLEQMIHKYQFTPMEIKQVAMLAAVNYEYTHIRTKFIDPNEFK